MPNWLTVRCVYEIVLFCEDYPKCLKHVACELILLYYAPAISVKAATTDVVCHETLQTFCIRENGI